MANKTDQPDANHPAGINSPFAGAPQDEQNIQYVQTVDDDYDYDDDDEYEGPVYYRKVNPFAVTSLVLGVLSFITMFSWFFFVIPVAAIIFGWVALGQMTRRPGQYMGNKLAISGILIAVVFWTFGIAYVVFVAGAEVPIGYTRVTFTQMQPNPDNKGEVVPQEILDLQFDETAMEKKRVFIKGYIYPGRQTIALKQFILVPTQSHCKFCSSQIKSTQMITVKLEGDLQINYRTQLVHVGGKLKVNKAEAARPLGGIPYTIDADYVK
ncbi:MAG: DUF4190 domain-containing protein [Pirellulales bacterium]|nr:DUF4190 domain-containing protein [Pirellulales bacterium]